MKLNLPGALDKWFDKFEKWDVTNLKSDMSAVTNDLAEVGAGRVLGLGQTVIWNTNTAGEIQWNRDGTFSEQISPGDEENLEEILDQD